MTFSKSKYWTMYMNITLKEHLEKGRMRSTIFLIFIFHLTSITFSQDDEPGIPSHLPSPPEPPKPRANRPRAQGAGALRPGAGAGLRPGSLVPNPPPQNLPEEEVPPPPPPVEEPPPPVPFGLNHIILILVPQFKVNIPYLPKWMGANAKVALPISVFFDKLKVPEPPPTPFPGPFFGPKFPGGHFIKKRSVEELLGQNIPSGTTESSSNEGESNKKESSVLNEAILRAERVTIIPKLENLLQSFGLGGKPCLLRAVCEVHEGYHSNGYGLVGEVLTLFFSVSRSLFAESHLSEYLKAEDLGKTGDCQRYLEKCPTSLFYWERIQENDADLEDEEFDLLEQLLLL